MFVQKISFILCFCVVGGGATTYVGGVVGRPPGMPGGPSATISANMYSKKNSGGSGIGSRKR